VSAARAVGVVRVTGGGAPAGLCGRRVPTSRRGPLRGSLRTCPAVDGPAPAEHSISNNRLLSLMVS